MATLVPPHSGTVPPTDPKAAPTQPEKVDYMNLPCPIPYEEIQREALMSLKPELFEGMRFDFTKGLNQRFSLSHRYLYSSLMQLVKFNADFIFSREGKLL
nr:mitochondrial import receptor subunit TOM40-1-like [Ipomoea batatas]GMD28080.1 mitochondrial import receptor subunit TOM40-1-like [Ipomoea batatas]